jgi:post-segregation antitoxin (ccd killing protein)
MPRKQATLKRRTTLTLPADSLEQAQKIAHSRQVNLSTVISEVISEGLRLENARHRRDQILNNYRKAFAGFSTDELAILDGIILEPLAAGRR